MAMRKRLQDLLQNSKVSKIFVESASRVARSAKVAEEIYEAARESGTEIVMANNPTLFKLDATPEQNFFGRVHFAAAEYECDCLVECLHSGLEAPAAKRGVATAQGRKSIIEKNKPTKQQEKALKKLIAQRERGDFGYRPLAQKMSAVLKLDSSMSMETCRRLCASLQ
jgi:DNA invertase Pin-like site-specific DNA recombinase